MIVKGRERAVVGRGRVGCTRGLPPGVPTGGTPFGEFHLSHARKPWCSTGGGAAFREVGWLADLARVGYSLTLPWFSWLVGFSTANVLLYGSASSHTYSCPAHRCSNPMGIGESTRRWLGRNRRFDGGDFTGQYHHHVSEVRRLYHRRGTRPACSSRLCALWGLSCRYQA